MKKFVIALIVVSTSAVLIAQEPGAFHRHGRRAGLHQLAAMLDLTDAQRQQMKDIRAADRASNRQLYADFRAKVQSFRALRKANDTGAAAARAEIESMKSQIQSARKATHEAMLNVLTADQRAQLQSTRGERGFGGRRGGALRQAAASKLNLTNEQKEQIHQLRQSTHQKNEQLFADAKAKRQELRSLTRANDPRASDVKAALEALRPQLQAARQEQHTAFLNILTPEQRTQLEQWKSRREQKLR